MAIIQEKSSGIFLCQLRQAAGEAAALALETDRAVADVDIAVLQKRLADENVMIHFPDEYIPEDRTVSVRGSTDGHIDGHN